MGEKPGKALAVREAAKLAGNYHGDALQRTLEDAAERYHLVSPATSCGSVPEGCEVAISAVQIQPTDGDTYDIPGGKRGLSKTTLDRIAAAAGVSWDPHLSRRLDDGSDPRYCRFHVVGRYRHFDGSLVTIQGTKEMDLREGSAQVEALWERYAAAQERWNSPGHGGLRYPPKSPEGQIREMRLHIESHAETKARLRAIRSLGIRTSYTAAELARPFVVARLMFTGRSDDPTLQREFALMRGQAMLGATAALYGSTPQNGHDGPPLPPKALPAPHAPPPVAMTPPDESEPGPAPISVPGEPVPPSEPEAPRASGAGGEPPDEGPVIPFGKNAGTPIASLSDRQLVWYRDAVQRSVDDPERARWRSDNERLLAHLEAELAERNERGDDPDAY